MDTGPNCGFAGYPDCFVYSGFQVVELVPHRRTLQLAPPVGEIAEGDTVTFTASSTDGRPITVRSWIWQDSLGVSSTPACSISSPRCTIVAGGRGRMHVRARVGTNTFVEQAAADVQPVPLVLQLVVLPGWVNSGDTVGVIGMSAPLARPVTALAFSPILGAVQGVCEPSACAFQVNSNVQFSGTAKVNGVPKSATVSLALLPICLGTPQPPSVRRPQTAQSVSCAHVPCDPSDLRVRCYVPLTGADSLLLVSITQYLRPYSEIQNPVARAACEQAFGAFTRAFQQGRVFRGAFDGPLRRDGSHHYATTYADTVHIEPSLLRSAQYPLPSSAPSRRMLLSTLLHEGFHLAGRTPHSSSDPHWQDADPWVYTKVIYPSGSSICVK
jgi:hypothetical protein